MTESLPPPPSIDTMIADTVVSSEPALPTKLTVTVKRRFVCVCLGVNDAEVATAITVTLPSPLWRIV